MRAIVMLLWLAACDEAGDGAVERVSSSVAWGITPLPCVDGRYEVPDPGALIAQVWAVYPDGSHGLISPSVIVGGATLSGSCGGPMELRWIAP